MYLLDRTIRRITLKYIHTYHRVNEGEREEERKRRLAADKFVNEDVNGDQDDAMQKPLFAVHSFHAWLVESFSYSHL